MIKKVHIKNIATIKDLYFEPYRVNYIFGGNGSGKTTISNFLSDSNNFSNKDIINDTDSDVLVYNKNFVDSNFMDKNAIHGIFTIGKSAVDAEKIIEEKNLEKKDIEDKIGSYQKTIDKLQEEINELEKKFENNCWAIQKEIGDDFSKALVGFRGSIKIFATKCKESFKNNFSSVSLDSLITDYSKLYQKEIQEYPKNDTLNIDLKEIENNSIFSLCLVKSSESNFSKFIEQLGNLNWVSQGLKYLHNSGELCPFCQQKITSQGISELSSLFDDTFVKGIETIKELQNSYNNMENTINEQINIILEKTKDIPFLSQDNLLRLKEKLNSIIKQNKEIISNKILNPATSFILLKTDECLTSINAEIEELNKSIESNNKLANNLKESKINFSQKLWDYIANNKLHAIIQQFIKDMKGKNEGLAKVLGYKKTKENEREDCIAIISDARSNVVCIDNTIDKINNLLKGFGFNGFKIDKKDEMSYKLIRQDGSEVRETLSEGEHRFITFLYFYELVEGTFEKSSTTKNKILVIDDPISSLDSNILFIVSYLVRDLIKRCLGNSNIEQVFILTHNIYFHQEICYKGSRDNNAQTKEHFFIIRKVNEETMIESFEKNQINSSYELLWKEYKNPNIDGTLICNIMRRILEHYFNVIGNKNYEKIIDSFDGEDKIICKVLLPFINVGSHNINDDLHISLDLDMVEKYKKIFKLIFEKTHQIDHYNMMMGIN